ncbi:hypothetical protein MFUR16E_32025 [Methylobacterium fujisawaense]|uniref:hypothetical protein n=1 Tax=Methylobacterium fujisawaense TaxID=107400 RepID=UPI002F2FF567
MIARRQELEAGMGPEARDTADDDHRALLCRDLAAATLWPWSVSADDTDAFALVEAAFAVRLRGARALAHALGMQRLRSGEATGAYYREYLADAPPRSPFADVEMRLSRFHPAGIAVLTTRPGISITPEAVRARYGSANWEDRRPELPTFYLAYPRAASSIAFGLPRGAGTLHSVVLNWGRWT